MTNVFILAVYFIGFFAARQAVRMYLRGPAAEPITPVPDYRHIAALEHECEIRDEVGDLVAHTISCAICADPREREYRRPSPVVRRAKLSPTPAPRRSRPGRVLPPWETGQPWREEDLRAVGDARYTKALLLPHTDPVKREDYTEDPGFG